MRIAIEKTGKKHELYNLMSGSGDLAGIACYEGRLQMAKQTVSRTAPGAAI
jgi:hypothetical protein